jgi:hypothetical protein
LQEAVASDGLLYHEADLSIATHHTDGGGVSDHTFALAYLLGFYFAPRIPIWRSDAFTPSGGREPGPCSSRSSTGESTKS